MKSVTPSMPVEPTSSAPKGVRTAASWLACRSRSPLTEGRGTGTGCSTGAAGGISNRGAGVWGTAIRGRSMGGGAAAGHGGRRRDLHDRRRLDGRHGDGRGFVDHRGLHTGPAEPVLDLAVGDQEGRDVLGGRGRRFGRGPRGLRGHGPRRLDVDLVGIGRHDASGRRRAVHDGRRGFHDRLGPARRRRGGGRRLGRRGGHDRVGLDGPERKREALEGLHVGAGLVGARRSPGEVGGSPRPAGARCGPRAGRRVPSPRSRRARGGGTDRPLPPTSPSRAHPPVEAPAGVSARGDGRARAGWRPAAPAES